MSLRWKGKPDPHANKQVDHFDNLCLCKFVAVGKPLNGKNCDVHGIRNYPCARCQCSSYRPNKPKLYPTHWPLCCCGHIAQEHD